jgi:predicted transcriptional regulator YdeE
MAADFERLQRWKQVDGGQAAGDAFSVYHTWDLSGGKVKYTSGFPVSALPEDIPADFVIGEIPELPTFAIEHVGPYRHLPNAWSVGMQLARSREFRQNKGYPPFEVYVAPSGSTPEAEQRVLVHFPAN